MEKNINQALSEPYTILNNRVLWYDGDSSYTVDGIIDKILNKLEWKSKYIIDKFDFSINQFNRLNEEIILKEKNEVVISDNYLDWNIPQKYLDINIKKFVYYKLSEEFLENNFNELEENNRINRVKYEFKLWEKSNNFKLLNVLIYIIDIFKLNNIIWGTGRGSSCCSYILYLIGVHDVDSVKYELNTTDFFRV